MVVASAAAQDVITIGAIMSVTGSFASHGEPQKKSVLLIQDLINNRGGIFGRKLKIIIYDDESDVNSCLLVAEKLLNRENAIAVIGPTTSGNTLAVSEMFEEARIPLLSLAGSEKIVDPNKRWIFKLPPSNRQGVRRVLSHVKSKGVRRIAFLASSSGAGREARTALEDLIPGSGLRLVAEELLSHGEKDMTARLEKIMDTGAQAIICWAAVDQTAAVARKMAELGITLPLYGSPPAASRRFIKLSGNAAEGARFPVERMTVLKQIPDDHPQKEPITAFSRAYRSRYNAAASLPGGYARDAVLLIIKAIGQAGSLATSDIRHSLENIRNFVGVGGLYNFGPGDHAGIDLNGFEMVQVRRGKFRIVK